MTVAERNLEVLEQYELEVREIRRGRGAFLCDTSQGMKLLREYKGTVKRLEFEEEILSYLKEEGFCVDQYTKTTEGNLISIAPDGSKYILKDWYLKRECDLHSERDVIRAVCALAKLHRALRKIPWKEEAWNLASMTARPLSEEMERHNRELVRVRNFVRAKRKKTEFELCIIASFEKFYQQAKIAAKGLAEAKQEEQQYLCHGDMNQHHILLGEHGPAFIEFNRMHRGMQIEDLYRFVRKTLEKQGWNAEFGMQLLEEYQEFLPLSKSEKLSLYYLFLYPEKYWKQMNFYFNNNKAWIPIKNIEKLMKLEEQFHERDAFLQKIHEKIERF